MSDPEKEAGKEDKEPVEAWMQRLLEPRPASFSIIPSAASTGGDLVSTQ